MLFFLPKGIWNFCRLKLSQNSCCFLIVLRKRWKGACWIGIRSGNYFFTTFTIQAHFPAFVIFPILEIWFLFLLLFSLYLSQILKGREDDNIETIRKRFKVFLDSSLPVIQHYNSRGKVRKVRKSLNELQSSLCVFACSCFIQLLIYLAFVQIDAGKPVEEVFEAVKIIFTSNSEKVQRHCCVIL